MEPKVMSKEQLIERVEELSTNLEQCTSDRDSCKAKTIEYEKVVEQLRSENESLKNEVKVQKEATEMYRGWWNGESEKIKSMKDKIKSIAVLTDCIVNSIEK